jgi:hypothetical protein
MIRLAAGVILRRCASGWFLLGYLDFHLEPQLDLAVSASSILWWFDGVVWCCCCSLTVASRSMVRSADPRFDDLAAIPCRGSDRRFGRSLATSGIAASRSPPLMLLPGVALPRISLPSTAASTPPLPRTCALRQP